MQEHWEVEINPRELFSLLDADSDGYIQWQEVNRGILDPALEGSASALVLLRSDFELLRQLHNDGPADNGKGVSLPDLQIVQTGAEGNAELRQAVERAMRRVDEADDAGAVELFADASAPEECVGADVPRQGVIGDCFLVASLSAVAGFRPGEITQMIKQNGDGTYTVIFPGAKDSPVTVDAPTFLERALFAGGDQAGIWPLIVEKAYGRLVGGHTDNHSLDIDFIADGGKPGEALRVLTGAHIDDYCVEVESPAKIEALIASAMDGRRPVVAGTDGGDAVASLGLAPGHAYTVLGYDRGTATVTLRNPYGHKDDASAINRSGTFQLSLADFMKGFTMLSLEADPDPDRRPAKTPSFG